MKRVFVAWWLVVGFLLSTMAYAADADMRTSRAVSLTGTNTLQVTLNNGQSVLGANISGLTAGAATLVTEGSSDGGTTWVGVNVYKRPTPSTAQASLTTDGVYVLDISGLTNMRFRVSVTGTGSATITYTASTATTTGLAGSAVPSLTYSGSTTASVGTTSGTLAAAGAYIRSLTITTLPTSTTNVWLNVSCGSAVINAGLLVSGGGGGYSFGGSAAPIPTCAITAITDGVSAQTVSLSGG